LSQRLFESRLALVAGLDGDPRLRGDDGSRAGDGTISVSGLRDDTVQHLHRIVLGMNPDNFLVRAKRQWVDRWSSAQAWQQVTPQTASEAAEHLAGLPSAVRDDDENAKRFDLLMLTIQLAVVDGDGLTVDRLRPKVGSIATNLLGKLAIPAVAAQQKILADVETDEWWADVTLPLLELARRRIRGLVGFADRASKYTVYTDFTDELGDLTEIDLPGVSVGTDLERFRAKARAWLREHDDHVTLQKLRRNRQLTDADLSSLERVLLDAGIGSPDDLERASTDAHGLGLFVRSLVGLDRAAATEAFTDFIHNVAYTASQLDFINLIIEQLTATGVMEPARLYESPFTDRAPTGPEQLFTDPEVDGIVVILDEIRDRAVARPGPFGTDTWIGSA
jgi:type I restriction enzyme R subunit